MFPGNVAATKVEHLGFRELRLRKCIAACLTSLRSAIGSVLAARPKKEMISTNTEWYVTLVQDALTLRDGPTLDPISSAMRSIISTIYA